MVDESGTTPVELPSETVSRIEERVRYTEFESVESYVSFVLEQVLRQVDADGADREEAVDQTEVEDRLRSLGYLKE